MTDESAAGPGTETQNIGGRCERVAAGLEARLADCEKILGDCFAQVNRNGLYHDHDMRNVATFLKIGAQLAGTIARLEIVRNRGSIPQ